MHYRRAALERDRLPGGGWRCAHCGRHTRNEADFEADHVVPLVDGGSTDLSNVQLLCLTDRNSGRCHVAKTSGEARTRARARGGRPMPVSYAPSLSWVRPVAGLTLLGAAGLEFTGRAFEARWGLLAVLCASVGAWWWRRRFYARRAAAARLWGALAKETGSSVADSGGLRVARWSGVSPVRFTVGYSHLFADDDPEARSRLEAIARRKTGRDLTAVWQPHLDRVLFRAPSDADVDVDVPMEVAPDAGRAALTERLDLAIRGFIRTGDPKVEVGGWDAIGPTSVAVGYPSTFRDDSAEVRLGLQEVINAKAPGRWRLDWDTGSDRVVAARRPPMPKVAMHPVLGDVSDSWRLPFAVDEDGREVAWDLRIAPHCLVAGETGGGKSVTLRALVVEAALRRFEVRIADPKRVEMMGLRGWPGVAEVATDIEDMIDLIERMHAVMDERYAEIEARRVPKDSHRPILLVVDEVHEWIERANAWWKANKEKGQTGTVHPVVEQWRSILRLGRTARIHVLVGIQRPDASIFGGAARDLCKTRIGLGAMSQEGAKMMFNDGSVGRDVPADAKGRATVDVGFGPREAQVWFTPDPEDVRTDEGRALLAALRPGASMPA